MVRIELVGKWFRDGYLYGPRESRFPAHRHAHGEGCRLEWIGRIEAHNFVAFLAYCLHVTLRARLRPLASGLTPRAVLDKFAAIQMLDVHFPTTDGRTLILSRYTELNADQKLLVKQLNLDLPVQPRPRITAGGQIVQAAAPAL